MDLKTLKQTYCHLLRLLDDVVKNEKLSSKEAIITDNPKMPTPWAPIFETLLDALTSVELQLRDAGIDPNSIEIQTNI